MPIPEPDAARRDRPGQVLLVDAQTFYGPEHHDHFVQMAALVQTQQGLQTFGHVILPWQPEQSDLLVHKVQIIRGGTVVDLLAEGRSFTVLRRENNLESAVLDGVLTAVMQADGLAVGDVLSIAYTIRRRAGALPLRGESFFFLPHGNPVERYRVRQIWPGGMNMRWRGTDRFEQGRTRRTSRGTVLLIDLADAEGPAPPQSAPTRFALPATLQVTEFGDWSEISAMVAPHYERASVLAPDSPLRAQIERIASTHPDARGRAMAALRLVQDDIRYFALVMGDGNYLPTTADETWTRRYGDCKAKTVTLVALLRGLGIDAEPVLVNATMPDGLDQKLPQMSAFNHVIVRARIDGRSYWLDGTRVGDRDLESLASSILTWGLPIRPDGSALEAIPFSPPAQPLMSMRVTYDGSNGFGEPVPFRNETIARGDSAVGLRMALSQVGRDEFIRRTRESGVDLNGTDEELTDVDVRDDPENGTFTVILSGKTRLNWTRNSGTLAHRFRFDDDTIDWEGEFERTEGPYADAPFALDPNSFVETIETLILPDGGRGFTLDGDNLDRTVAGVRISRNLSLIGGRAVASSRFQTVSREVTAAEARASIPALREIKEDEAYLVAPMGAVSDAPVRSAEGSSQDSSASALLQAGYEKMKSGQVPQALVDFDRVIALAPDWARAHGNRAIALLHLERPDEAREALAQAMRRDPDDFVVHQGYGYLHLQQDRPEEAIRALTRSLELEPDNSFTLGLRSWAYRMLDRHEEALADADKILTAEPGNAAGHIRRAVLLADMDRDDEAVAAMDAAQAADPTNFLLASQRGDLLSRLARPDEAASAYRHGLQLYEDMVSRTARQPTAAGEMPVDRFRIRLLVRSGRYDDALALVEARLRRYPGNYAAQLARCWLFAEGDGDLQGALRECNLAREYDPEHDEAMVARGFVYLRLQRWSDAAREFDQALAVTRDNPLALYGRGIARLRIGQAATGEQDLIRARRLSPVVEWEYEKYGLAPVTVASSAP